jgi:hypothetical protein
LAATIIKTYFLLKQRSGEGVRPLDFFGFVRELSLSLSLAVG